MYKMGNEKTMTNVVMHYKNTENHLDHREKQFHFSQI